MPQESATVAAGSGSIRWIRDQPPSDPLHRPGQVLEPDLLIDHDSILLPLPGLRFRRTRHAILPPQQIMGGDERHSRETHAHVPHVRIDKRAALS